MKSLVLTIGINWLIGCFDLCAAEFINQKDYVKVSNKDFIPTISYEVFSISGIDVLISPKITKDKKLKKRTIDRLTRQIDSAHRLLPKLRIAELKPLRIWVELNSRQSGYAEYHAYKNWLQEHHKNPDKFKGIEITNISNYLKWSSGDPLISSVLVHEIAHAYFHSLTEQQRKDVFNVYLKAVGEGLYRNVLRLGSNNNGRPVTINRAWALQDEWEYFSELSESIFAKNDYFPHTSRELERYDPSGYKLIKSLWE